MSLEAGGAVAACAPHPPQARQQSELQATSEVLAAAKMLQAAEAELASAQLKQQLLAQQAGQVRGGCMVVKGARCFMLRYI